MATDAEVQSIIGLYVGYFNRVPDTPGLQYHIGRLDSGRSLNDIAQDFFETATSNTIPGGETQTFTQLTGYTAGMSDQAFIEQLYSGYLGRELDTGELTQGEVDYWIGRLNSDDHGGHKGSMVLEMLSDIASYSDESASKYSAEVHAAAIEARDIFAHKVRVAEHYSYEAESPAADTDGVWTEDYAASVQQLSTITDSKTTVTDLINPTVPDTGPIQLTKDADDDLDVLNGLTTSSDEIDGRLDDNDKQTLQATDVIDDPSTTDNDVLTVDVKSSIGGDDDGDDGPTIDNVETINLIRNGGGSSFDSENDADSGDVVNLTDTTNVTTLNVDGNLNVVGLDGDEHAVANVISDENETTHATFSEVQNEAVINLLSGDLDELSLDSDDDSNTEEVTVNVNGAGDFVLGSHDDNDDTNILDGGEFGVLNLVTHESAITVTLDEDTSLNNVTDTNSAAPDANPGDDNKGAGGGADDLGTMANTGLANLASQLVLEGTEDGQAITIVGTGSQLDEADIDEAAVLAAIAADPDDADAIAAADAMLTTNLDLEIVNVAPNGIDEVGGPVDLTEAAVDHIDVEATGTITDGDITTKGEVMEVVVDENAFISVDAISDFDALVITGEHSKDVLEVGIDVGAGIDANANLGALILGGDASASTGDSSSGDEDSTSSTDTEPNAASAIITVESASELNVLDVSQLTDETITLLGSESLRVDTLVMGGNGPEADTTPEEDPANTLDATAYTGDLVAYLSVSNSQGGYAPAVSGEGVLEDVADGLFYTDGSGGYDDGEGTDGDQGFGVTVLLGSGDDTLGNVGVVRGIGSATPGENSVSFGDNIDMGAGDDTVHIGFNARNNENDDADTTMSAEIIGGEGEDSFVFHSIAETVDTDGILGDEGDSTVEILDFETGRNGDKLDFELFRDHDGESSPGDDGSAPGPELLEGIFSYDEVRAELDPNDQFELVDGSVVLLSVDDIDDFAGTTADFNELFNNASKNLDGNGMFTAADTDDEYVFLVGEDSADPSSDSANVKIFYVSIEHPTAPIDVETSALIGQLNNVYVDELKNDNFEF